MGQRRNQNGNIKYFKTVVSRKNTVFFKYVNISEEQYARFA